MPTGVIEFSDEGKGFGFIRPTVDYLVRASRSRLPGLSSMASGSFLRSLPIIRIRKSNLVIADDPRKAGRGPWRQQGAKAFRAFNMVSNEVFADAAEDLLQHGFE